MALINCKECNKEVSSVAAACPHCGAPTFEAAGDQSARIIEQSSKKLKIHYLYAFGVLVVGVLLALILPKSDFYGIMLGYASFAIAAIWAFVTKIRIWWHHE